VPGRTTVSASESLFAPEGDPSSASGPVFLVAGNGGGEDLIPAGVPLAARSARPKGSPALVLSRPDATSASFTISITSTSMGLSSRASCSAGRIRESATMLAIEERLFDHPVYFRSLLGAYTPLSSWRNATGTYYNYKMCI
jgi:hypothetical protein